MLRPLSFIDQNDVETHQRNNEFMLGDHLLICPVTIRGAREIKTYLPAGGWYHNWDDQYYKGSSEIQVAAPLKQIPLFIREGAVVPTWPQMQFVGEKMVKEITLHVYYKEGEEKSNLYLDDGENMGYKSGHYEIIRFDLKGNKSSLKIWQNTIGTYHGKLERYKLIITGLPFKAEDIIIDGRVTRISDRNRAMGKIKFTVDKSFHEIVVK
jgi:alpha-glucosidase